MNSNSDGMSMVENNRLVPYDPAAIVPYPTSLDLKKVPLSALGHKARSLLSARLNLRKILPTEDGLPRDWRGILHCTGIATTTPGAQVALISRHADPIAEVLKLWNQDEESQASATFSNLLAALEMIDRFDIADDIKEHLEKDAKHYLENKHAKQNKSLSNQSQLAASSEDHILTRDDDENAYAIYDAYILFVDEDIEFATTMIEKLENKGLKVFYKDRDLLAGIPSEIAAVTRMITERCNRLVVICSVAFVKSRLNAFYVNYAQALGIDQGRRKIIPCVLYEKDNVPNSLSYFTALVYNSPPRRLFNFWDKLYDALKTTSIEGQQLSLASNRDELNSTKKYQRQDDEIVNSNSVDNLSQPTNDENFDPPCRIMPPHPAMRKTVSEINLTAPGTTNGSLNSAGDASHNASANSTKSLNNNKVKNKEKEKSWYKRMRNKVLRRNKKVLVS